VNLEEYRQMYELENTHWYFRGKRTILHRFLSEVFQSNPDHQLLDVGCGTGNILLMLQNFGHAVGVDSSPVALEFCRSRNLTDLYLTQPGEPLPFDENTFDIVTAFDLLEHIDNDLTFLKELRRVSRNGGKILIIVPAHPQLWSDHDVALHHKRRYTRKQFQELIAQAQLTCNRLTYFNSILFPAAFGYRTFKRILPKKKTSSVQSEFFIALPRLVNQSLLKLFELEGAILPKRNIPFGLSLLAVCEKPAP
jgi:ubiquinone/menaquinone biosynthesis C-methylase UbiE